MSSGSKPYRFVGFGDIHGPKPFKILGFGDIHGPKASKFMGFGDAHGPKPCKFTFPVGLGPNPVRVGWPERPAGLNIGATFIH